MKEINRLY